MTNTLTLKTVRAALAGVFDSVGFSKKNGCFVAKRGYFYHHGLNEEKMATALKTALPSAVVLEASDQWHAWPKDSWIEVRFTA